LAVQERHLGLVPATENGLSSSTLERLTDLVVQRFDLQAIRAIAESAAPLADQRATAVAPVEIEQPGPVQVDPPARVGVAQDRAFGFYYADTFDLLGDLGAEVVPFSALDDAALPANVDAVYLGGGFPELYARDIAANDGMRRALEHHVRRGAPLYAECGGLMALGRALVTLDGEHTAGFGLLPLVSRMTRDRLTIGYREVETTIASALGPAGTRIRGHEFHRSTLDAVPNEIARAYSMSGARSEAGKAEGYMIDRALMSYVHLHFGANPSVARSVVSACAR